MQQHEQTPKLHHFQTLEIQCSSAQKVSLDIFIDPRARNFGVALV